jgi:hypothetical protein
MTPHSPDFPKIDTKVFWNAIQIFLLFVSTIRFCFESIRTLRIGFDDFRIFWDQAVFLVANGAVYYPEALSKYAPHSGTYKFPPLFLLFLIPFVKYTDLSLAQMKVIWFFVDLFLYLFSIWLLVRAFNTRHWIIFSIVALNYEPFFETLHALQMEILILICVSSYLFFLSGKKPKQVLSGISLAVACNLKIYPAFLFLDDMLFRRKMILVGAAVGSLCCILVSVVIVGYHEVVVYFSKILPYMMGESPEYRDNLSIGHTILVVSNFGPRISGRIGELVALISTVLSLGLLWRRRREIAEFERATLGMALLIPLMLFALPNSWSNYQLLLLPCFMIQLSIIEKRGLERQRVLFWPLALAFVITLFSQYSAFSRDNGNGRLLSFIHIPAPVLSFMLDLRPLAPILLWLGTLLILQHGWTRAPALGRGRASASNIRTSDR